MLPFLPLHNPERTGEGAFWLTATYFFFALTYHLIRGPLPEAPVRVAHLLTGFFYGAVGLTAVSALRLMPNGMAWVIAALVITWANDTAAYFAGRFLGRHKLYPAVSPNKTWEGFFGGMVGSVGGMFIARAFFYPTVFTVTDCVFLGIFGGILGPIGDLCESMLKRAYGVKDSGIAIPGHGGILDRIDALHLQRPAGVRVHHLRAGAAPVAFHAPGAGLSGGRDAERRCALSRLGPTISVGPMSFILLLGVLITVHELGHFLLAKACGVKVLRFSIGFGPKLVGFTKGETEYQLALLPLGGYVKMAGDSPHEELSPEEADRGFLNAAPWKRALIVAAGPLATSRSPSSSTSSSSSGRTRPRPRAWASWTRRCRRPPRTSARETGSSPWRATRCRPSRSCARPSWAASSAPCTSPSSATASSPSPR